MQGSISSKLKVASSIVAIDTVATINGASIDTKGDRFGELICILSLGIQTGTTPTCTVKLQDSADDASFADISGAAFSTKAAADDDTQFWGVLDLAKTPVRRFVRAVATEGGTWTACPIAVLLILANASVRPAQTPEFDL